jgi:hypothetical protein
LHKSIASQHNTGVKNILKWASFFEKGIPIESSRFRYKTPIERFGNSPFPTKTTTRLRRRAGLAVVLSGILAVIWKP